MLQQFEGVETMDSSGGSHWGLQPEACVKKGVSAAHSFYLLGLGGGGGLPGAAGAFFFLHSDRQL